MNDPKDEQVPPWRPDVVSVTHREWRLVVIVSDPPCPDSECLALIEQVMTKYPNANHAAIAAWFQSKYGQPYAGPTYVIPTPPYITTTPGTLFPPATSPDWPPSTTRPPYFGDPPNHTGPGWPIPPGPTCCGGSAK